MRTNVLEMALDGPCAGHACDRCAICRRGRCCRRDRPDYQLPELGSWDGPLFGELGVLAVDDEKAQCHACGLWFRYLANHVRLSHKLWADEYRAMFGLNASHGLVGPATRALQAGIARDVFHDYWGPDAGSSLTPEQRSAYARGRRWRLEGKKDQRNHESRRERARRRYEQGLWTPPKAPPPGAGARGVARLKELMQDPDYRAEYGRQVSLRAGARVQVQCVVCGATFETLRYIVRKGGGKLCGRECFREFRRREAKQRNACWFSRGYRELAAAIGALKTEALDALPDFERELLRRYYPAAGEEPWSVSRLAQQYGLKPWRVRDALVRSLETLLGPGQSLTGARPGRRSERRQPQAS